MSHTNKLTSCRLQSRVRNRVTSQQKVRNSTCVKFSVDIYNTRKTIDTGLKCMAPGDFTSISHKWIPLPGSWGQRIARTCTMEGSSKLNTPSGDFSTCLDMTGWTLLHGRRLIELTLAFVETHWLSWFHFFYSSSSVATSSILVPSILYYDNHQTITIGSILGYATMCPRNRGLYLSVW